MTTDDESSERADILDTLTKHRGLFRQTFRGITDEQARLRPSASELCLGGILKHVTRVEANWAEFIVDGPRQAGRPTKADYEAHAATFRMEEDETLEELLAAYDEVTRRSDDLVTSLPSLSASQPLPPAPWFPPGARWSARRVFMHIIAETAQHAGHADIVRETIDGAKTMG